MTLTILYVEMGMSIVNIAIIHLVYGIHIIGFQILDFVCYLTNRTENIIRLLDTALKTHTETIDVLMCIEINRHKTESLTADQIIEIAIVGTETLDGL